MKNRRVLRGQCLAYQYQGALHLVVDDGNYNDAWQVKRFVISYEAPFDAASGSRDCYGVLATHADAIPSPIVTTSVIWNWEDRRQVAWSSTNQIGDSLVEILPDVIDPMHVVVRDLYLGITALTATGTTRFNYFVELERVTLSDHQSVMALIQEEGQGA